jgi:hypothetical protein
MDKDLKEMFREKNRLIIINNLKYDLEKNITSLLDTITNIFNLEFDTAIKNIIAILEDSSISNSDKFITQTINQLKLDSYQEIEKSLENKKRDLDSRIDNLEFEEAALNDYYDHVLDTTKVLKSDLNKFSILEVQDKGNKILNQFILENVSLDKKDLTISRVNDYLKNRLYGKLETKIHMEVMLRDNNLMNKAKESYERFQEISSRTTD